MGDGRRPSGKFNAVRDGIYIMQRDEWMGSERYVRYTARYSVEQCALMLPEADGDLAARAAMKSRLRHDVNRDVYQPVVEEIKDIMCLLYSGSNAEATQRLHDMAWDLMRSGDDCGGRTQ